MKLRAFTSEETDELIQKFSVIAEYAYSINDAALSLMKKKHMAYIDNFKCSLFHWSFIDFPEFVKKIQGYNNPYFLNWSVDNSDHFFCKTLFSKDSSFFRGGSWYTEYYDNYMKKHGNQELTKEDKVLLSNASIITNEFLFNYKLREKFLILNKYAHRPFEFDEDDISWLESIELYYNKALEWKSNSQKK